MGKQSRSKLRDDHYMMVQNDLDVRLSRLSMDEIDWFRKAIRRIGRRIRRTSRSVGRHLRRTAKRVSRHARRIGRHVSRGARQFGRHVRHHAKRVHHHARKFGRHIRRVSKRVYHHARKAVRHISRAVQKGLKFLDDKLKIVKIAKGLLKVVKDGVKLGRLTLKKSWIARLLFDLVKEVVEAKKKKAVGLIQKVVRAFEKRLVKMVATQIGTLLELPPGVGMPPGVKMPGVGIPGVGVEISLDVDFQPFRFLKTHHFWVRKVNTAFKAIAGILGHDKSLEDHLQILFGKIINKKLLRHIPFHDKKIPIIGRTVAEEIEHLRGRIITALLKRYGMCDSGVDHMIMKVALVLKTLLFNPKDIVKTLGKLDLDPNELTATLRNRTVGALETALTHLVVTKLGTLIEMIPKVGQVLMAVRLKGAPIARQVNKVLKSICGLVGFEKTIEDRIQDLAALIINQKTLQWIPFHDQCIPIVGCTVSEQIENMRVKIVAAVLHRYGLCDGLLKERKSIRSKPKMSKDFKKIGKLFRRKRSRRRRSRRTRRRRSRRTRRRRSRRTTRRRRRSRRRRSRRRRYRRRRSRRRRYRRRRSRRRRSRRRRRRRR